MKDPSPLEFPTTFPIKVVGQHSPEFQVAVVEIMRRHIPDLADEQMTTRPSAGGKYIAITATFVATSREQLDNLYRELSAHELVVMLL